jgi:hypothetical protein
VNSCILTFKKQIKYIFILVIFLFIVINVLIYLYSNSKTSEFKFVNTKYSKTEHFKLNNTSNKDFIFIGSSKTFYNISTNQFKEKDIDIFNYGIAGGKLTDYPELIHNILAVKPKTVVISLSVNDLIRDLDLPKYPTINDMVFFYIYEKSIFYKSIINYLKHLIPFFEYSESIYLNLKNFYQKFNFNEIDKITKNNTHATQLDEIDCKKFDVKKENNHHSTVKCTNGDGVILGNILDNEIRNNKNEELGYLNVNVISYLNKIHNIMVKNSINTILILEPSFDMKYIKDHKLIKSDLRYKNIINLSNFFIKKEYFGDKGHFNQYGRKYYSNHLLKRLKKYEN